MTIPLDKQLHAVAGAITAICALLLAYLVPIIGAPLVALLAGAAMGIGYELVQLLRHEGQPDLADAAATTAGAGVVALLLWLITL